MSVIQNTLERSTFISDRFKALRMEANSIFAKDKTQISKKKPKSNLLELFSNVPRPFYYINSNQKILLWTGVFLQRTPTNELHTF